MDQMSIEDIIDETILIGAKSMTGFDDDDIDALDYLEEDDPLRQQWESARNMVIDKISESLLNLQEQYKARQKWKQSEKKFSNQNETVIETVPQIDSTNSNSNNPVFNPEIWTIGLQLGGIYLQRGINNFANWSQQMTSKIGEKITPWLNPVWKTLESYPEETKFDENQITMITKIIGKLYGDGTTDLNAIKSFFAERLGKDLAKSFEPMIDASYNGIRAYFEENEIDTNEKKIDDISEYIPRIWNDGREWMWFEKAWEILDKYKMTSYKNFVEQGQVTLRAVTLAMMYIDFCKEAFDEWYGYEELFETFERSFLDYDREIMEFLYAQLSSEEEYPGFEDAIYELTDDERPKILKVLHKEMSYSIMCYGLYCTGLSEDFYLFYSEDDYDDEDDENYRCNLINIDDCESYWKSIDENSSKIDNEFYNSAEFDNLMAGYSWLKNSYAERLDYDIETY